MNYKSISKIGMFVAIMAVFSWINIPLPIGIPFSMQVLGVFLTSFFLGADAWKVFLTYLLLGIIGIPVFSGFRSGIEVIIGPTGGFLIGFLVSSFLGRFERVHKLVLGFLQILTIYSCGIIWFMIYKNVSFFSAFRILVPSFIWIDSLKLIAAYVIYKAVNSRAIKRLS